MPDASRPRTALVLSGGGARGAYQVGVLRGLVDQGFLPRDRSGLDIVVGSSAGAINAAALVAHADDFDAGLARRGVAPVAARFGELDQRRRHLTTQMQEGQARRNEASKAIGQAMGKGDTATAEAMKAQVAQLKETLPQLEAEERALGDEIDALLARAEAADAAVVIVPDRHGRGTNGLLLHPPDVIQPAFGVASCDWHRMLAAAVGAPTRIERLPSLALDVDTPADLDALLVSRPTLTRPYDLLQPGVPPAHRTAHSLGETADLDDR